MTRKPGAGKPVGQSLHELSNVLAVTLARTEALLADEPADLVQRAEALRSIRDSVLRARDVVSRLWHLLGPAAVPAAFVPPPASRLRVLVIDDHPLILDTVGGLLTSAGYDVETAPSGEEGLERYRRRPFDCVVTDARLGGISGFVVCRAIKDDDPGAHVVLLTGLDYDPEELRAAGVDRVLAKPSGRAAILEAVRRSPP